MPAVIVKIYIFQPMKSLELILAMLCSSCATENHCNIALWYVWEMLLQRIMVKACEHISLSSA